MLSHVAIIMDGNGRWAQNQGWNRSRGHQQGLVVAKNIIQRCFEKNIPVLTLFAFSKENWKRPLIEVDGLFHLFNLALKREVKHFDQYQIRLKIIGDRAGLNPNFIKAIEAAESLTRAHTRLTVNIAINYSGRWDIQQAVAQMRSLDDSFESYLSLAGLPEPDLLIRTGGVSRLSNFLLWDIAYTELYFSDLLWPDFSEAELDKAIHFFNAQKRRFGGINES